MLLKEIYKPVEKELIQIEDLLRDSLERSRRKSILNINNYVLVSPGKRLRPALVALSSKAVSAVQVPGIEKQLVKIATSIELIHMASLIHDDVIDHANLRHNKPTINTKFGEDISIALGDYLYSIAFQLISRCGNLNILDCISSAAKEMCEGELVQVCERDNISLLKKRYLLIIKKKTATLFAASCEAGAIASGCPEEMRASLRRYGLNFGIAFQIIDDCMDLIGKDSELGKLAGADFNMGELTLPALNLLSCSRDKKKVMSLLGRQNRESFQEIRKRFIDSRAFLKTREDASSYLQRSKKCLAGLDESCFKQSLTFLADYMENRIIYDKS
ncbi:MAG: polyprenyl synthetase family protein [Candidatus Omnitrophota bacterium]|nr:polyprenyl synthetase family protein [Candidatus Omnitrophota bacterium]